MLKTGNICKGTVDEKIGSRHIILRWTKPVLGDDGWVWNLRRQASRKRFVSSGKPETILAEVVDLWKSATRSSPDGGRWQASGI
jgi:hypothetical protein